MITGLIVAIAASITGSFWLGLWFAIRIGGARHYRGLWDEYRREYDAAYEQAAAEIWTCMRVHGEPDAIAALIAARVFLDREPDLIYSDVKQ